jgi:hypothetical protein
MKRAVSLSALAFFLAALPVFAQDAAVVTPPGIGGISFATMLIVLRFAGALWASVGLAYFIWGMVDYLLSHENAHHKAEARSVISEGFVILVSFALAWGFVRIVTHLIFG